MKQKRFALIFTLALASGLMAGYLALNYLRNSTRSLVAVEAPKGQVVVAARDLPVGTVLRAEDVRLISWPADAVPQGYKSSVAEVVGRGTTGTVLMNEPLLDTRLADKDSGGGMPILIPEGMRALSVRVDEVIAVAGFVTPGTRVDVLLTVADDGSGSSGSVTRVIMQNVQVIAAGQTVQRDVEGKPQIVSVITVLLTPDQAERLTLASGTGRIQMALRSMTDVAEVETPGVRQASLIVPPSSRSVRPQPVRVRSRGTPSTNSGGQTGSTTVEMYRGGVRTLSTFSNKGQGQ